MDLADDNIAKRRIAKVAEAVAREIVHDIRGLAPYTRLPSEAEMVGRYGVGRGSLREALRILEVQGLIIIRPGTGGGPIVAQVRPRNYADMSSLYFHVLGATYRDVMEARMAMEPLMARLAAQRQRDGAVERLEALAAAPPADEVQKYLDSERDFHTMVSQMSGNPVLDLMGRALKIVYTDKVYSSVSPEMRAKLADDHVRIADAIAAGEADAAEELMREHMVAFVQQAGERNPGLLEEIVDWH